MSDCAIHLASRRREICKLASEAESDRSDSAVEFPNLAQAADGSADVF
jgi:hypothetical protein